MEKKEALFYLAITVGTLIFEIANNAGFGQYLFLPTTIGIIAIGYKLLGKSTT